MAKPRKSKNEEQKADNSEAVVKHQKLCLSIDMEKRRIYGYTELEIIAPENGIVGLHADNLAIDSVTVDGEPAQFEVFPQYFDLARGDRWSAVSTTTSAADAAGYVYLSSLERELAPNLLIMCSKSSKSDTEQHGQADLESEVQTSTESTQNAKVVRIEYWVEKAETGIHFDDNVLHTDNQIRRARCWFPCMDDNLQLCSFDMEFTVAHDFVAVSTGTLLYQVLSNEDPPRKTFVYRLSIPVAPRFISFAVAPFEIVPDQHNAMLSHMCLSTNLSKLQNSVAFFHNAFSYYEEYLSASFPFGCYTQVFISPEMAISSLSLGAAVSIFSSNVLFDDKVIDQTISTRIKLASALARQWFGVYITSEAPNDDWLLDGLAGFLTDSFIKRSLGNNEALYRRYKANCAVCGADDSGATALCSSASSKDLYGTECIGFYGKIRSWKSVAILQMLEKQMGPEHFRKILQIVISRAQDTSRPLRTLSTKEFRHFANKVGNLERPFLKEFFPRWVGSCGCPVLKLGFSYSKRKNIVEVAVLRGCTARPDASSAPSNGNPDPEKQEGDVGWPGMMSIRVHEFDGMYDHPMLPMSGESWQLLEVQCHSKLAAKRFQKSKKGSKPDGSDDNADYVPALEVRSNSDSPLQWLRADPEMEYLAEIHFNQPVQMWINQLEKDKDVVAQSQAIAMLEALPQKSFSVVNALNNFLTDSKAFWRIRIEAAFALAHTACEETDWAGLLHLIKYYKSRRFDPNIGLPKPNDFHDFQEYFVLEAIPLAVATVRTSDNKSPREAIEFILQLLKYNDNNGNPYTDVFWLAAMVQSVGELEFGQQTIVYLSSLLKRLDRLLQFDRLMPSYNGVLTISCIRSLTQIAMKLSEFVPLDRVIKLIEPFRTYNTLWNVRVEASRALLDLEFQSSGIDAALLLFIKFLSEENSLRGQVKLGVHALRLCQMRTGSDPDNEVKSATLVTFLRLLESPLAFNNVILRHHLFCILQVLSRRSPTLFGVPRDPTLRKGHAFGSELKTLFADLVKQAKHPEPSLDALDLTCDGPVNPQVSQEPDILTNIPLDPVCDVSQGPELFSNGPVETNRVGAHDSSDIPEVKTEVDTASKSSELLNPVAELGKSDLVLPEVEVHACSDKRDLSEQAIDQSEACKDVRGFENINISGQVADKLDGHIINRDVAGGLTRPDIQEKMKPASDLLQGHVIPVEASKEPDTVSNTVSNGLERKKPLFRIRVKHSAASSRAEDPDTVNMDKSRDGLPEAGASSSVSVDAPQRMFSQSNQNLEDVSSFHDGGSRVTASIGSAKFAADGDELGKELQCTADSSKVSKLLPPGDHTSTSFVTDDYSEMRTGKYASLTRLSIDGPPTGLIIKERDKKKDKDKKRKRDEHKPHHNDPEYLEKKRLKKEKKRREKEIAKLHDKAKASPLLVPSKREETNGDPVRATPSLKFQVKKQEPKRELARTSREAQASPLEHGNRTIDDETKLGTEVGKRKAPSEELYNKSCDPGPSDCGQPKPGEPGGRKLAMNTAGSVNATQSSSSHKFKIKIKKRTLDNTS
ncbi:OLC1v1014275C1 [Oldenlandia corymbosa var. corymbosa]|uniref:Transcription initiation factor TFIID subunit 2 n=1 Tax=Oldenlandia corymbosa var. corymbosa TaxID=529605 RepID=A0AAV1E0N6_OLDCO|nr:OLC1v1014275C1 [Oldenlandia corymbosa var. corymbosa]